MALYAVHSRLSKIKVQPEGMNEAKSHFPATFVRNKQTGLNIAAHTLGYFFHFFFLVLSFVVYFFFPRAIIFRACIVPISGYLRIFALLCRVCVCVHRRVSDFFFWDVACCVNICLCFFFRLYAFFSFLSSLVRREVLH